MQNVDKKIYDVLIIGGGAGGLFASTTANFFNLKNVIVEQKNYLGGQPLELYPNKYIYDFPCFEKIKSSDVIKKLIEQQNKGEYNDIMLDTKIININKTHLEQELVYEIETNKNNFIAKHIIIATGNGSFNPKKLEVDGKFFENDNIHYSVNVASDLYKDKKIVVLGGGDSAVDWANFFIEEKITKNVVIIHRRNQYRCSSKMVDQLTENNIVQKLNYDIVDVQIDNNILKILSKDNNNHEYINYDYLIVQYGQQSSNQSISLFDQINKEKNKIIVDMNQKTNLPYIYAIGDAIIYPYKANTIVTACAEATKAIWHISKNKKKEW